MSINHFKEISGFKLENLEGTSRYAYTVDSSFFDVYDLPYILKDRTFKGSLLKIYDLKTKEMYIPFTKREKVFLADIKYFRNCFYLLFADFNLNILSLFEYVTADEPELLKELKLDGIDLYNLRICVGDDLYIISEGEILRSFYPKVFEFELHPNEGLLLIEGEKVFLNRWVEVGWDDENNISTEDYNYYDMFVVRDFDGRLLSEEIGSFNILPDGSYWIS